MFRYLFGHLMSTIAFNATRDIPELGVRIGDILVYNPSQPAQPWSLHRAVLGPGSVLHALNEGALEPIDVPIPAVLASSLTPPADAPARRVLALHSRR